MKISISKAFHCSYFINQQPSATVNSEFYWSVHTYEIYNRYNSIKQIKAPTFSKFIPDNEWKSKLCTPDLTAMLTSGQSPRTVPPHSAAHHAPPRSSLEPSHSHSSVQIPQTNDQKSWGFLWFSLCIQALAWGTEERPIQYVTVRY